MAKTAVPIQPPFVCVALLSRKKSECDLVAVPSALRFACRCCVCLLCTRGRHSAHTTLSQKKPGRSAQTYFPSLPPPTFARACAYAEKYGWLARLLVAFVLPFIVQTQCLGVSKALLATEKDVAQGKLRLLFTAPEAIVGDSRQKQMVFELPLCIDQYYSDSPSPSSEAMLCATIRGVRILLPRTLSVNDYIIVRYFPAYYTENKR